MSDEAQRFCYSPDGERFYETYPTREQAAEEGFDAYPDDDVITTGIAKGITVEDVVPSLGNLAIEEANDTLCALVGEAAEDNEIEATDDQVQELSETLAVAFVAWFRKHNLAIHCYTVEEMQKHRRPSTPDEIPPSADSAPSAVDSGGPA